MLGLLLRLKPAANAILSIAFLPVPRHFAFGLQQLLRRTTPSMTYLLRYVSPPQICLMNLEPFFFF